MQTSAMEMAVEPPPRAIHAHSRPQPTRNRLPNERASITHKFNTGGHEGYITAGLYPDGSVGEIFIVMAKEGSTVSGLVNSFAQAVSIGLQHGVPLQLFCEKFSFTRFEPCGWTGNPEIPQATSVMDYIFRWLKIRFLAGKSAPQGVLPVHDGMPQPTQLSIAASPTPLSDSPSCRDCGSLMNRNGSCHVCPSCGWTSGCG